MSKLTIEQVREIRKIGHKETMRELAKKYKVKHTTIFRVIHRKTKKDLWDKPCSKCGR